MPFEYLMVNSMGNHITVGLTGSIGSGKSQAATLFEKLGAKIIDADLLAREVVQLGQPALAEVRATFGPEFFLADGHLDRKRLAQEVFNDANKRKALEGILHPRINLLFKHRLAELRQNTKSDGTVIIYVVPLLFESGLNKYPELQKVIVVSASEPTCIKRIMQRDNCSQEDAQKRYSAQTPIAEKVKAADYVIDNDGSLEALEKQVSQVFTSLTNV